MSILRFLLAFLALSFLSCVSKRENGVVVPTVFGGRFSIPKSAKPPGSPKVYLHTSYPDGRALHGFLILWENGACANTGGFRTIPRANELTPTTAGSVGHYSRDGEKILIESFGTVPSRRAFVLLSGRYAADRITLIHFKRRGQPDWKPTFIDYERYPVGAIPITPTW
jgi:hypothetical protein